MEKLISYFLPAQKKIRAYLLFGELDLNRVFIGISLLCIAAMAIFTILYSSIGSNLNAYLNIICIALFTVNLFAFKNHGNHNFALFVGFSAGIGNIATQHATQVVSSSHAVCWMPVMIIFGRILLSKKYSNSLTAIALIAFSIAEYNRLINKAFIQASPGLLEEFIVVIFDLSISGFITYFCVGYLENNFQRLTKRLTKRIESNRKLLSNKASLLNVVCHDIVNPLTIIDGITSIFSKDLRTQNPRAQQLLESIDAETTNISNMIQSVRNYSSSESGKLELNISPTDLSGAILNAIESLHEERSKKSIEIVQTGQKGLEDHYIEAELLSLGSNVLKKIIENSIKYSPEFSLVRIETEVRKDVTIVRIRDRGVGIAPSLLSSIRTGGHSSPRQGTMGEKGAGLGLLVAKSFMNQYEGSLEFDSAKDSGGHWLTTVSLTFKTSEPSDVYNMKNEKKSA